MKKKLLLFPLWIALTISALSFGGSLHFGAAQAGTNVTGIITSDATWTKANSPYTLTGPVAVNTGVTLTIEAGTFANLNNFYIQVNGTLIAKGSSTDQISFNNGKIIFTSVSNGWNETTGSGCIIENAILHETELISSLPLKVSNSTLNKSITAGSSSMITNNNASANWIVVNVGEASVIANNIINGIIDGYAVSLTVANNTLFGGGGIKVGVGSVVSNNYVWVGDIWGGSTISNNTVNGRIFGRNTPVTISNNTVYGSITSYGGETTITYNTIYGGGITLEYYGTTLWNIVSHNIISGAGINLVAIHRRDRGICLNATISFNNASSINVEGNIAATIERNIFASGGDGVRLFRCNATVVNNIIAFNNVGILNVAETSTILNNTIAFNNVGISLYYPIQTISYNSFENTSEYNVYLNSGVTVDVDVANNWWGTTDAQAINQSIWDFNDDFNLGTVNFVPFLTAPNPVAPEIPTFNVVATTGTGGAIDPTGSISVPYGGSHTFSITADTGYDIVDVLVDGSSVGAVSSYTFTNVQAEHTISATFEPTPTPTPSPAPSPTPTASPTSSPEPTTGINLPIPLFYGGVIAFITSIAIMVALIIKIKR